MENGLREKYGHGSRAVPDYCGGDVRPACRPEVPILDMGIWATGLEFEGIAQVECNELSS